MDAVRITSTSEEDTRRIASALAQTVQAGDVIVLAGDLGAGKTRFVQGFASGLGTPEVPTSPTFTLVCEHQGGRLPLYHFDLYRLEDVSQLDDIDFWGIVEGDGVSLVEWGDKFEEALEAACLIVEVRTDAQGLRSIEAISRDARGAVLVEALATLLA